jgi:hypothetical protein
MFMPVRILPMVTGSGGGEVNAFVWDAAWSVILCEWYQNLTHTPTRSASQCSTGNRTTLTAGNSEIFA